MENSTGFDHLVAQLRVYVSKRSTPLPVWRVSIGARSAVLFNSGILVLSHRSSQPWHDYRKVTYLMVGKCSPRLPHPLPGDSGPSLCIESEDHQGRATKLEIVKEPFYLVAVQKSEVGKERFSYLFRHHLKHEGWRYVSFDANTIFGHNWIGTLAQSGITIHATKEFHNYVRTAVSEFHAGAASGIRYDQFGWKNDDTAYFSGRFLYTPGGKVLVQGSNEVQNRADYFGPQRPTASLTRWSEAANNMFGRDNLALGIGVLAAFASVLMRFALTVDGGCVVHLFSTGSGKGKSWAMDAGISVWGSPRGCKLLTDYTDVSKSIVLGTMGNSPVFYDEIDNKDPDAVRAFIRRYSDGSDRLRGTQDGGTKQLATSWRNILVTNSNYDLVERVDTGGPDAAGLRILQFLVEKADFCSKAEADDLKRRLEENAGTAGDKFLQYIVNPAVLPRVKEMVAKIQAELWSQTGLKDHYRYRVAGATCIIVAGLIVKHLDILDFDIERIRNYIVEQLTSPINAALISDANSAEVAQSRLSEFLGMHLGEVLTVPDRFKPGRGQEKMQPIGEPPRNRVSIRFEVQPLRLYISEPVLKGWCLKHGISYRDMITQLKLSQVVVDARKRMTLTAGTRLVGAAGWAVEINAEHPCISAELATVERLATVEQMMKGRT